MNDVRPPPVAEAVRGLIGASYLVGGVVHLVLWRSDPDVYAAITAEVLFGWYRGLWTGFVLPNLDVLLPVLAAFEYVIGGLVLGRDRAARAGNGVGMAFQVALAPLGFWWPTNVLLAFGHAWLGRYDFDESVPSIARRRLRTRAGPSAGAGRQVPEEP